MSDPKNVYNQKHFLSRYATSPTRVGLLNRGMRLGAELCYPFVDRCELDHRPEMLQGESRDYSPYIIMTHARSGSSMLSNSLNNHANIVGFGELFAKSRIAFHQPSYDNYSLRLLALRNRYPIDFLERYIFAGYQPEIQAVGFKLFPEYLDTPRFSCVWSWLEQQRDIVVIHLNRRNLLKAYISRAFAFKYIQFGIRDKSQRLSQTLHIQVDDCLKYFQFRNAWEMRAREATRKHRTISLDYEDLAASPAEKIADVATELEISDFQPQLWGVKQEVRPLSEVIENFDALRQALVGSQWVSFLDEDNAEGSS